MSVPGHCLAFVERRCDAEVLVAGIAGLALTTATAAAVRATLLAITVGQTTGADAVVAPATRATTAAAPATAVRATLLAITVGHTDAEAVLADLASGAGATATAAAIIAALLTVAGVSAVCRAGADVLLHRANPVAAELRQQTLARLTEELRGTTAATTAAAIGPTLVANAVRDAHTYTAVADFAAGTWTATSATAVAAAGLARAVRNARGAGKELLEAGPGQ